MTPRPGRPGRVRVIRTVVAGTFLLLQLPLLLPLIAGAGATLLLIKAQAQARRLKRGGR